MNFHGCKEALCSGKRVRRKSWRDNGHYITASYRGRNWEGLPAEDCDRHTIGLGKKSLGWIDVNIDVLKSDWEMMPEPDYEAFGKNICYHFRLYQDGIGLHLMEELAERHGLCHSVQYDPGIHGNGAVHADGDPIDPGDKIYYFEDDES